MEFFIDFLRLLASACGGAVLGIVWHVAVEQRRWLRHKIDPLQFYELTEDR